MAVNQTSLQFAGVGRGAPGNRSSFKSITRKKEIIRNQTVIKQITQANIFFISFKKFLEDRNAAGSSISPKDERLRSPLPYAQQPRSPSRSKARHFEYKDNLPVAGKFN